MSLAQRFERRLEGVIGSAFARVFKGQVEPVEVGAALQREAADKRAVMADGRSYAPNRYRVSLSLSDHERLSPWDAQLCNSLAELIQEHLDQNGWVTVGDIEVVLHLDESLHTGVFGIASRIDSAAAPRRRPFDSLSLPVVPGQAPGQYAQPFGSGGSPPPPYFDPYEPPATDAYGVPPQPGERPFPELGSRVRAAITVDGSEAHLVLRRGSNVIGRGHGSDLQLTDQGVSRRHVDVQFDGEYAVAYDLGSTNGTSVNGHPVGAHQLQHGDVLRIGHSRLVFHQETG